VLAAAPLRTSRLCLSLPSARLSRVPPRRCSTLWRLHHSPPTPAYAAHPPACLPAPPAGRLPTLARRTTSCREDVSKQATPVADATPILPPTSHSFSPSPYPTTRGMTTLAYRMLRIRCRTAIRYRHRYLITRCYLITVEHIYRYMDEQTDKH